MEQGDKKAIFQGQSLSCRRGGRIVFAALDFTLHAGDGLILRGPNGSGKSSLLRLMAGLSLPVSGTLLWYDQPIKNEQEAHAARLCYIGHQDGIKPLLSTYENLLFWAGLLHPYHQAKAFAQKALGVFGLSAFAQAEARTLSAGQKHRLSLARLLLHRRVLWLLDEPATGLDAQSVTILERLMIAHRSQGGMIVMATHGPFFQENWHVLDLTSANAAAKDYEARQWF